MRNLLIFNPLPIQPLFLSIIVVMYAISHHILLSTITTLHYLLRIEEVTADEGRIEVLWIRFSLFEWTVERRMYLSFVGLLVNVNCSD